ncbi:polyketide cyclase/dehydrase/lipid transport protein [Kribbella sp. VKM Ac-2571]|uniref:SRPBCC family protein n=1 Tax=Kribbella sp. VKM Ac-2571 TaxID=2512222 RepID=UPI00105E0D0C|nr:SRPBCC family protein [Kribbella sp. VKM Ac-2571]TDO56614.1 polyketide cyclase/dehydrase/lipid transport protein [Kribbella sp. VKM Ac-2571]
MRATVSIMIAAPPEMVCALYADYSRWPEIFPTISHVRLLWHKGTQVDVEVTHREGMVVNTMDVRPPGRIDLWELKLRYNAWFSNRFECIPAGTLFTVDGHIRLKGWVRWLSPLLGWFVRRQMKRYQLLPIKRVAEADFQKLAKDTENIEDTGAR